MEGTLADLRGRLGEARVLDLLALSAYLPAPDKMAAQAAEYEADSRIRAFGWEKDGKLPGAVVLRRLENGNGTEYEILSIGTDPAFRGQGVGSRLIGAVAGQLGCTRVIAETDDDAVEFYRRCGFAVESLGEKYPGTVRYRCTRKYSQNSDAK